MTISTGHAGKLGGKLWTTRRFEGFARRSSALPTMLWDKKA
jgi:hypothetical protein